MRLSCMFHAHRTEVNYVNFITILSSITILNIISGYIISSLVTKASCTKPSDKLSSAKWIRNISLPSAASILNKRRDVRLDGAPLAQFP